MRVCQFRHVPVNGCKVQFFGILQAVFVGSHARPILPLRVGMDKGIPSMRGTLIWVSSLFA